MTISNKSKLEFCIFLINSLAEQLGLLTPDVYKKLNDSGILDEYIMPLPADSSLRCAASCLPRLLF